MDAVKIAGASILAGVGAILVATGGAWGDGHEAEPFEHARLHFEQNATDGDVEVVFDLTGGDEGLKKLTLMGPNERILAEFTALSEMGIRSFKLETPEPEDVEGIKESYPEGVYTFEATTVAGEALRSQDHLSHDLPQPGSILLPDAPSAMGMRIGWTAVPSVLGYIVEIEQDDLGVALKAQLPASATSFAVPDGFLMPGTRYGVGLGTVSNEGNISYVETTFETAGKK